LEKCRKAQEYQKGWERNFLEEIRVKGDKTVGRSIEVVKMEPE
jgi:hypothetical protein